MNIIDYLKNQIAVLNTAMEEVRSAIDTAEKGEEVRSYTVKGENIKAQISAARAMLKEVEERADINPKLPKAGAQVANGGTSSIEYREAFKNFIQKRTALSEEMKAVANGAVFEELRAAGTTVSADIAALCPQPTADEIVKKVNSGKWGQLYARVRKLNMAFGPKFPISELTANWNWGGEDKAPVGEKAGTAKEFISFNAIVGYAQINTSLVANIVSLPIFEATLSDEIAHSFLVAMDTVILNGNGTTSPLGITKDPRVTGAATFTAIQIADWKEWKNQIIKKIPLNKRGGQLILPIATIDSYLSNLHDDNNKSVFTDSSVGGYGNFSGGDVYGRVFGQEVIAVENTLIKDFDSANAGDVIGVYANLHDYAVNSNLQFAIESFEDKVNLQTITRGLVVLDGKPLDTTGMIVIKKA